MNRIQRFLKSKRGAASIGMIFITFLLTLLGIALTDSVQDMVDDYNDNLTGAALSIFNLIPLIWVFLVISIGAAAVYVQFKTMD